MAAARCQCINSRGRRVLAAGYLVLLMWWCEIAYVQQDPTAASNIGIGPMRQVLNGNRHTQNKPWRNDGLFTAIGWQSAGWLSWATQRVLLALILVETTGYITTNVEVKYTMSRVGDVLNLAGQVAVWWSVLSAVSNRGLMKSPDQIHPCQSLNKGLLACLQLSATSLSHLALQMANNNAEAGALTAGI